MGSYPHVNPGDVFKPSVQEENDIRDLLNAVGRDGVRSNRGGMQVENICINAYNQGESTILDGTVVTFVDALMIEGAVRVVPFSSDDEPQEWGIAQGEIEPSSFGSVLVMGIAIVTITDEEETEGNYVVPNGDGGGKGFSRSANGIARILQSVGVMPGINSVLILVGCSSGGMQDLSVSVSGNTASIGLSGSTSSAQLVGTGDVEITGNTNGQVEIKCTGGGGGADGIEATVDGGTASIMLTGGTGSVNLVGTGSVTISENTTTGNIEINSTGGGGGGAFGFPDYSNVIVSNGEVDLSGTTYSYPYPVWLIGTIGAEPDENMQMRCEVDLWLKTSTQENRVGLVNISGEFSPDSYASRSGTFVSVPIPANIPFYFLTLNDTRYFANDLCICGCLGQNPPLADYTVTRATGTTNGTLFYGLSQKGDNTVSVDSSLDGTPIDFEGASVL